MFDIFFNSLSLIPSVIWLFFGTLLLGYLAFIFWTNYVRNDFISGIDFVLLEIVPPREVLRSPVAMELFFTNALYHFTDKGVKDKYWKGAVPLWFSLEIVSINGHVHFYIYTPSRIQGLIETQMYAQYPQAQIKAVEDYTLAVNEISKDSSWNLWGCEYKLIKEDGYPIKTYVDFGLEKDAEEQYKIDPISPVIELFGSIKKGEQMWLQIVITPSKKSFYADGKKIDWVEASHSLVEKLQKDYSKSPKKDSKGKPEGESRPAPKWLDDVIKGINKKTLKLGFDTGIRFCYVAKKEAFDKNSTKNSRLIFHQYSSPYMNQFVRTNSTSGEPSSDSANSMLEEYRDRMFFNAPFSPLFFLKKPEITTQVLNTEELATLFHFPGQVLKVPTLERVESKEASPPSNLPM
jgi:hypothetical protein